LLLPLDSGRRKGTYRSSSQIPQQATMILILGLDDIKDLRGGHYTKELIMIGLLDTLQFQFHLITFLDHLLTSGFVSGFDSDIVAHPVIEGTLLLLHLPEQGEESSSLLGSETSLLGDILLQISLILLRRESLLLLLKILLREALLGEILPRKVLSRSTKHAQTNQADSNKSSHDSLHLIV